MRIERLDRIVIHTDAYRVEEIGKAERNTFDMELEAFKDVILGRPNTPPAAEDAVRMTELVESIRAFDAAAK